MDNDTFHRPKNFDCDFDGVLRHCVRLEVPTTLGTETPECGVIEYIFHSTLREMFGIKHDVSIAG